VDNDKAVLRPVSASFCGSRLLSRPRRGCKLFAQFTTKTHYKPRGGGGAYYYNNFVLITNFVALCVAEKIAQSTGLAKKTDCFGELITLRWLMGERHVICQKLQNFV